MAATGTPVAPSGQMRGLLLSLLLAVPVAAQGVPQAVPQAGGRAARPGTALAEKLERPLLYARIVPASGPSAQGLLRHPVLAGLGLGSPLTADGGVAAMLGDLAGRAAGPVEIAWTGTIPAPPGAAADRPLLLFRAELDPEDAARMADILAEGRMAVPHRQVGRHRSYRLALEGPEAAGGETAGGDRPGQRVEVVLSGTDLLVSNHGRALEEVLGAVALHGPALAEDPDYLRLWQRLEAGPGVVQIFADVRRLLRHAPWDLRRVPVPRHALAVLEPEARTLSASLVLDFGGGPSWSAALQPARAGELVGSLLGGGLALSLAADVSLPRGGRGVGSRTGADRSPGRRGALIEVWERAGRALGARVRLEERDGLRLLIAGSEEGDERDASMAALLRDLGSARREVLGMFALSVPAAGGGGIRLVGSLEKEGGADAERLLRVRALCAADG